MSAGVGSDADAGVVSDGLEGVGETIHAPRKSTIPSSGPPIVEVPPLSMGIQRGYAY